MVSLAILLLILAFVALGVAVAVFASSAVLERLWWRRVATHMHGRLGALGLRWDQREAWRGNFEGRSVAARLYPTDAGVGLRIYIRVPTGSLAVRLRSWWSRTVTGARSPLGASRFDTRFAVVGTEADRAYLGEAIRAQLVALGGPCQIRGGWLTWDETQPVASKPAELERRLQRLVRLSDALWAVSRDPVDRLERAVLEDPDAGVRRRTLVALHRQVPAQAERLAFRALVDADPHVRWTAARIAGAVGTLAHLCTDEHLPLPIRRAAGADLLQLPTETRHLAVARLLCHSSKPCLQRLAGRLAGRAGSAGSTVLLELLRHPDPTVKRLAARGLARSGSMKAARPLRAELERTSWVDPLRGDLWLAFRSVVGRCASRAGTLAFFDERGGELALSDRATPSRPGANAAAAVRL